jgi:transcriptional regulator with XRE-family HTH domain
MFPTPQPIKAELARQRRTVAGLARATGYTRTYVGRIVNGWLPPSPRFRQEAAHVLGMAEEELFRADFQSGQSQYPGDGAA